MGKVDLNIGIEPELVEQAERPGIAIAGMSEVQQRRHLQKVDPAEARAKRWAEENAEAIRIHHEFVDKHGCFGEDRLLTHG